MMGKKRIKMLITTKAGDKQYGIGEIYDLPFKEAKPLLSAGLAEESSEKALNDTPTETTESGRIMQMTKKDLQKYAIDHPELGLDPDKIIKMKVADARAEAIRATDAFTDAFEDQDLEDDSPAAPDLDE